MKSHYIVMKLSFVVLISILMCASNSINGPSHENDREDGFDNQSLYATSGPLAHINSNFGREIVGSIHLNNNLEPVELVSKNKLLFLISFLIITISSILIISLINLESAPAYLVGLYLIGFSQVVLTGEIASLFSLVNSKSLFLTINCILLIIATFCWLVSKKPRVFGPFYSRDFWISRFSQIKKSFSSWIILWVFGVGIFLAFAYTFYLIIFVPQNIDDVLTTHLARIGYWLQNGSFYPWQTSTYNLPQVISPANAQILILWSVLFWGGDQLAAMTQWTSAIIAMLAIYGISKLISHSVPKAIFCSLLFITMPSVAIQMSTALTDLLFAALFLSCVYLLFLGWKTDNQGILILSSLAFALSLGTKQTGFFAIPGLMIAIGLLFRFLPLNRTRNLTFWVLASVFFFILVGVYFYIQNQLVFGRLLGPKEVEDTFTNTQGALISLPRIKLAVISFITFSLQTLFAEFSPNINNFWGSRIPYLVRDLSAYSFGTPSFLVYLLVFFGVIKNIKLSIKRKEPFVLSLMVISLTYFLILLGIRQFTFAVFRYSILTFGFLIPLINMGFIEKPGGLNGHRFSNPMLNGIVFLALAIMSWTILMDGAKPSFADIPLYNRDRVYKQTLIMPDFYPVLKLVNETIPIDSTLGLVDLGRFPQSPLFGKYYERTVIPIFPSLDGKIDLENYQPVEYLLIDRDLIYSGLQIPDGFKRVSAVINFSLYQKSSDSITVQ